MLGSKAERAIERSSLLTPLAATAAAKPASFPRARLIASSNVIAEVTDRTEIPRATCWAGDERPEIANNTLQVIIGYTVRGAIFMREITRLKIVAETLMNAEMKLRIC